MRQRRKGFWEGGISHPVKGRDVVLWLGLAALGMGFGWGQEQEAPTLDGYVTQVSVQTGFAVNGFRVLCGPQTQTYQATGPGTGLSSEGCSAIHPWVGEAMQVDGKKDERDGTIRASLITASRAATRNVSGAGVVVAAAPDASGGVLLSADGYRIVVSAKTAASFWGAVHGLPDLRPGDWMEYSGKQQKDGLVMAESVRVGPQIVSAQEMKFREGRNLDPAKAPAAKLPVTVSGALTGFQFQRIRPESDPAMETWIDSIGARLIPKFEGRLAANDPARIDFRFYLVDEKRWREAIGFPNGVVLVPVAVAERLQDDSEMAAVLAYGMAGVLEREAWFELPTSRALEAGMLASDAGWFVPGLGLAGRPTLVANERMQQALMEHNGRVALELMHEAGFDVEAAPRAWWRLSGKPGRPLWRIRMPWRAQMLYGELGSDWQGATEAAGAAPAELREAQSPTAETR